MIGMARVSAKKIKASARSIVRTMNLSRGDGVAVIGGVHAHEVLEEIALECYKRGATPSILTTSDNYMRRVYKEIPARTLEIVPKQLVGMAKAGDAVIMLEDMDDPRVGESFPRDKIKARRKGQLPLQKLLGDPKTGKKWLYAGWPTEAAARRYGIPYSEFEDMIIGGISVSPDLLMRIGKRLDSRFRDADWVHVWDSHGTDFRVRVEGRVHNLDDGFISKADYDRGDRGANLPAGELFIAPHEETGGGTLFCPLTRDRNTDKLVTDVMLEFRDGRILLDRTTADKNESAIAASFRECEELDALQFKPVRTRNVAELGIGYNPRIKKAIGYILTDEKITGTVHLAFGLNKGYGGRTYSTMHWDFVSAPGASVEVELRNGKKVLAMDRGKFI